MSNPSLFFAIAGISMSFAGFAGLFLALRPHDSAMERVDIGQLNTIVLNALTALFSALLVIPLSTLLTEDIALRGLGAVVLVLSFYGHQVRIGTSWLRWQAVETLTRREMLWRGGPFIVAAIAEQLLLLANVLSPSQDVFGLALILMLGTPAMVFVTVVTDMNARRGR